MSQGFRAIEYFRSNGLALTLDRAAERLREMISPPAEDVLFKYRRELSDGLFQQFGGIVQEGPLKGFRLAERPKWGAADRGTMLLGMYETRVMEQLIAFGGPSKTLIDIGAADGYYGVGCVASGVFARSVCFELDPDMRTILRMVAQANGVEDKVTILGAVEQATFISLLAEHGVDLRKSVILCDIEGAELDLLDDEMLKNLASATFVIELHEIDHPQKPEDLVARAEKFFEARVFDGGARNPYDHQILHSLRDDDRWLLCSEGRNIYQKWLVLEPLNAH